MKFEIIDEYTYNSLNCKSIFSDLYNDVNHKYAKIVEGDSIAKIAWSSDLLLPQILETSMGTYAIGIDQSFAIYDFNKNHRILNLDLMYSFYEIVKYSDYIFVATELEVIVVDIKQYKILNNIPLLDLYKELKVNQNNIEIYCIDNTHLNFKFLDIV